MSFHVHVVLACSCWKCCEVEEGALHFKVWVGLILLAFNQALRQQCTGLLLKQLGCLIACLGRSILISGSAPGAGYGNSAPNDCWGPIIVVTFQTLVGIFLDAVVIGVIFARISHPKCVTSLIPSP